MGKQIVMNIFLVFSGAGGMQKALLKFIAYHDKNKANLRDLIAATGLVFLHKIGFKSLIFCDLEIL